MPIIDNENPENLFERIAYKITGGRIPYRCQLKRQGELMHKEVMRGEKRFPKSPDGLRELFVRGESTLVISRIHGGAEHEARLRVDPQEPEAIAHTTRLQIKAIRWITNSRIEFTIRSKQRNIRCILGDEYHLSGSGTFHADLDANDRIVKVEPRKKPKFWRHRLRLSMLLLGLALVALAGYLVARKTGCRIAGFPISRAVRFPEQVLDEDFQRPLDRDILEKLYAFDRSQVGTWIDWKILKPIVDDVTTLNFSVNGVEITAEQYPQINDMVNDCARILGIKRPHVYVANRPGINALTANFAEPIIVIHSELFRRFTDPLELRFIIGHEMGHIRCRHVKWMTILNVAIKALPLNLGAAGLLPFLKWAREAEMSADNAGLLCCQNIRAAETALARMVLNKEGRINVDEYLKQREKLDASTFAEAVLLWNQLAREHPFIPDRIVSLREYAKSPRYRHLWED